MRVLADGCFDPLHIGHLRYFHACGGDPLIVRVAPDSAIRAKGREPFQTQEERALLIHALGMVDRVCFNETLGNAIRDIKPDVLAKGSDWRGKLPEDVLAACQEVGARIVYTDTQARTSTERLTA